MKRFAAVVLFLVTSAWADQGDGLKISGTADIIGRQSLSSPGAVNDRWDLREAEVMLYAPIDHLFEGVLSLAAHRETDEFTFEPHEVYIGSTKLIPRSRFRIGQFFLGVGRLNQFHRHDWPFISAPKVQQEFFAGTGTNAEGITDTGVEYSYLTPLPFFFELTAGVTNGWVFGHAHTVGQKALLPTMYIRGTTFVPWTSGGAQIGLNFMTNRDSTGEQKNLAGLDFTAKWKEAGVTNFLLQSEVWYRVKATDQTQKHLGFYVFPNYYAGANVYTGIRFDGFTQTNQETLSGVKVGNWDFKVVPTISWKPSEFSTLRLAYNYNRITVDDTPTQTFHYLEAQAVFILGAHPAHDF